MEHCGYVVKVKEIRKHSNADRLQIATFFGNDTAVDMSVQCGDMGVYFPSDLQLGVEFATKNDLLRRKDENGNPAGGYLDPEKRNIRAMSLRREKSDGLYLPLRALEGFTDTSTLKEGDTISVLNGITICDKYIPRGRQTVNRAGNHAHKKGAPIAPLFVKHADTEQLPYHLSDFHPGDLVEITLKMHGTSQRTALLPRLQGYSYQSAFEEKLYENEKTPGWLRETIEREPVYTWGYVTGSRNIVLGNLESDTYTGNMFRKQHAKALEGKLHKGETVYYEVVGFTEDGTPIMPSCNNSKIKDKEFSKLYGKTTTFSYGCLPNGESLPQSDLYVYRMTMTNEDGDVVEYPPDYMRYRCEQMAVKCVPLLCRVIIPEEEPDAGAYIMKLAERFCDGADPIGKTHVREGVVCRIVNRPRFAAYKHKNFSFKCLEGIVKETASAPDMEEQEELVENDEG